jgi:hypothetical protein
MTRLMRANDQIRSPRITTGETTTRFSYYRFSDQEILITCATHSHQTHYDSDYMLHVVACLLSQSVIAPAKRPGRPLGGESRPAVGGHLFGLSTAMMDSPRRQHYTDIAWQDLQLAMPH